MTPEHLLIALACLVIGAALGLLFGALTDAGYWLCGWLRIERARRRFLRENPNNIMVRAHITDSRSDRAGRGTR